MYVASLFEKLSLRRRNFLPDLEDREPQIQTYIFSSAPDSM